MAVTISGGTPTFTSGFSGGTITSSATVATTSGTSVAITGIPSWAKRVTLIFQGVTTSGPNDVLVQVGSGSIATTGYIGQRLYIQNTNSSGATPNVTNCIGFFATNTSSDKKSGTFTLCTLGSNIWAGSGCYITNNNLGGPSAGAVTLSGALDRIQINTNTADTFTAGSMCVFWE